MSVVRTNIPGAGLINAGLEDIQRGRCTAEALLVAIGAVRLRRLGLEVPDENELPKEPELALYQLLMRTRTQDAYSQYNALTRCLVSCEQALEREHCLALHADANPGSG